VSRPEGVRRPDEAQPAGDPPLEQRPFATASGLPLPEVALPGGGPQSPPPAGLGAERVREIDATLGGPLEDPLGRPGGYPFTRGIHPTMYRGRLWTFRQYAGYATAEETNARFRYLLAQGSAGLSMAFDLPTQLGYDSDDVMSAGEVGRVGVAIDSLADMERVFAGIPLDKVSVSMTINATAPILLAMYVAVAERQGLPPERLRGTVQNDILKEYVARGTYVFPPGPSLRLITDVFAWCLEHTPAFNPISVSGYHIREAGADAVQELAFTLADAIAYLDAARRAGIDPDRLAPKLSFFFNASSDFFEEIAKFRAARRLYARIMRHRFGCRREESCMLRFHTQTSGHSLTAVQPEVNVVRVTLQALAAVLGGTQSLHTNAADEALGLPTEESARLALRIQQVIAAETGVPGSVDPLGGSHLVEQLTDRIECEAATVIETIDRLGGMVRAVESGWVSGQIEAAAYRHQCEVEAGRRRIVGINCHVTEASAAIPVFKADPAGEQAQVERLRRLRADRDAEAVEAALAAVGATAGSGGNLMPAILDAVRCYATVGEICGVLRERFGTYAGRAPG
jgi:methylmalonyl-CoA mutase N-terminal domain/subunit